MEKYSDSCKFIFICDQLSKIIEPIRSRCILFKTSLPTKEQIFETILRISDLDKIDISLQDYNEIISNSENKINQAIWFLELKKYNIDYSYNWNILILEIVNKILNKKNYSSKKFLSVIKKIRNIFYDLFITNIPTQTIIRLIMTNLLDRVDDLKLKINIIEITSIFELRLSMGTRNIIHFESYCIRLFYLFTLYNQGSEYKYNLDKLEI